MTIIFYCPDAPMHFVHPDADNPEYEEERSDLPSLDLSQVNAFAFLRLMHLPEESEGFVDVSEMPAVLQRLLMVVNSKSARAPEHDLPSDSQPRGKIRVIDKGVDDKYLKRRASDFMALFEAAQFHEFPVVWS